MSPLFDACPKRGLVVCIGLLIIGMWPGGLPATAAKLENPGDGQYYSGIGVISGWKCEAEGPVTVRFNDGPPTPLVYGSERPDTQPVCGDTANGFVAIWNWALLGDGIHTARVYDNGVLFAETTFQVRTLGVEVWPGPENARDFWFGVEGFNLNLAWNANTQHFEVERLYDHAKESYEQHHERLERGREQLAQRPPWWHAPGAYLENPGDGQLYSGIGVISGWKCEAEGPVTVRFNDGPPTPLVYGSERPDTQPVCGDTANGFVAIWNWALLGDGIHTARVYDNGVLFAETTFQVGTLGVESWAGVWCHEEAEWCEPHGFDTSLSLDSGGPGYDGLWQWSAPRTKYGEVGYFRWNAHTQHFEAVARRYAPSLPPEPPESWRWQSPSFRDRPDDFDGPQIHLYHAVPTDARGSLVRLRPDDGPQDVIGFLSASVQDAQRWLATQTYQGRAFRIDTYQQGIPDVTTLPLTVTTAEMQTYGFKSTSVFDAAVLQNGLSLSALGNRDPTKLHVVFVEAPPPLEGVPLEGQGNQKICGLAAPFSGVAVIYAGGPFLPIHGRASCGGLTITFLHEVFHLLGAVHPDAPHQDGTAHIYKGIISND